MIVRTSRATARAAFTLMEVLVVVMILVVLLGTGGVIYIRYLEESRKDAARMQIGSLTQVAETYLIKYGSYPPNLASLTQPMADGSKPYLEPSALLDPWGREYQYAAPGSHHTTTGKPDIWSQGPNPGDASSIIGNWSATGQ
jgi:general secretion pathway protein G